MEDNKIRQIEVKFYDIADDNIKNTVKEALNSVITYFEKLTSEMCVVYAPQIIILDKNTKINLNPYTNGCFVSQRRAIILKYDNDINKFKKTVVHELSHAKFNVDLSLNNHNLVEKIRNGDSAMYMINEYMAIKLENNYHYETKDLQRINKCQDNFGFYYKARKGSDIRKLKELATLISLIVVSENILNKNNGKRYSIYNKDILDIKKKLEKIEFIPTEEQYISLVRLLKEKGYKEYN